VNLNYNHCKIKFSSSSSLSLSFWGEFEFTWPIRRLSGLFLLTFSSIRILMLTDLILYHRTAACGTRRLPCSHPSDVSCQRFWQSCAIVQKLTGKQLGIGRNGNSSQPELYQHARELISARKTSRKLNNKDRSRLR